MRGKAVSRPPTSVTLNASPVLSPDTAWQLGRLVPGPRGESAPLHDSPKTPPSSGFLSGEELKVGARRVITEADPGPRSFLTQGKGCRGQLRACGGYGHNHSPLLEEPIGWKKLGTSKGTFSRSQRSLKRQLLLSHRLLSDEDTK